MTDAIYYFKPGQAITATPVKPVVGGTFVKISAGGVYNNPNIETAATGAHVFGVAARDADKDDNVLVYTAGVVPVTAGEGLTAGDLVTVGADGKAGKASDRATAFGQVLADAKQDEPASVLLSI